MRLHNVKITSGAVMPEYVHLFVELSPKYSVLSFLGYLKAKSALMIFDKHPEFKQWGDKNSGQEDTMMPTTKRLI